MAILSSMLWLTKEELASSRIDLRRDFAVTPRRGPMDEEDPAPIEQWVGRKKTIGLPIHRGLQLWEGDVDEAYAKGTPLVVRKMPDPNHPKAVKGQADFFRSVLEAVNENVVVLAKAPTGSGKTVTALNTAGTLGRSTVVVVPSRTIMEQWKREAKLHLGLTDEEIGQVGDGVEDWTGKPFVVVILHNLYQKEFPREFYGQFGLAIWDEAHNLGAREFSKVMHFFPSEYKLALTATPDRKDGCLEVIENYFGPVSVESVQKPLPITCYVKHFEHEAIPFWLSKCKANTKPLQWLSKHPGRNEMIAELACSLYDKGRHVLILCKFIDQAEELARLLVCEGILENEIGLFVGQRTVPELKNRRKVKQEELDRIKGECPIIIGTYSMMKEGVDIPRIDAGIEACPVADARQAIGRARRPFEGKPGAVWYSILDLSPLTGGLGFLHGFFHARMRGFRSVGVTIKHPTKKSE